MNQDLKKDFSKLTFIHRLKFATNGLKIIWKEERNFRIQCICAVLAFIALAVFKAEAVWWAIFSATSGAVLSLEAINSSVERTLDRFHPEYDAEVGVIKDCLAGAVLIVSFTSVVIFAALLLSHLEKLRQLFSM